MTPRHSSESGLTLVEILMTILIMFVGAAGLIALQAATLASGRFARDLSTANSLVASKAEELRLVNPIPTTTACPATTACSTLLTCGAPGSDRVDESGSCNASGRFTRCWCVTPDGTIDFVVQVLVAWQDGDQTPTTCGASGTHCARGTLRRAQ
jgi:Tfp pilus assembly protein PilV